MTFFVDEEAEVARELVMRSWNDRRIDFFVLVYFPLFPHQLSEPLRLRDGLQRLRSLKTWYEIDSDHFAVQLAWQAIRGGSLYGVRGRRRNGERVVLRKLCVDNLRRIRGLTSSARLGGIMGIEVGRTASNSVELEHP